MDSHLEELFLEIEETFKQAFECIGDLKKGCNVELEKIKLENENEQEIKYISKKRNNLSNEENENDILIEELLMKKKKLNIKKNILNDKKDLLIQKQLVRAFIKHFDD